MTRGRREIPKSYQSMRDSRNPEMMRRSYVKQDSLQMQDWGPPQMLMQSMHLERAKGSNNNSYFTSSNPSFDSHKPKLSNSEFMMRNNNAYLPFNSNISTRSFMKDMHLQRTGEYQSRHAQGQYKKKKDMHLRQSGKDFFKKRGSNLEKMRRDVQRFETELGKAKQILHGKKQSSFNDSRMRKNEVPEHLRSSIYEKSRKPKKRRREMDVMGNVEKQKRAKSKNKDFNAFRSKYSILGEKYDREGQWKKTRTARTMDKRKAKRSYVPPSQTIQYSSRNIPKLPPINPDMSMRDSIYKDKPREIPKTGKNADAWRYPKKRKTKELKLEDLYSKNRHEKRRGGRSKTPTRKPRRSDLGPVKNIASQLPQMNPKEIRKTSFITDTIKGKQRGIVNTRRMQTEKEKIRSKTSFHTEPVQVEAENQNSVGPYHSSKTDNNPAKTQSSPKVMLKFAVVNGLENGREKTGQDAVLVYKFKVKGEQFHVFGVFAGHGTHGHHVSLFLKKNLVSVLKKEIYRNRNHKSLKEILEESVQSLHRDIYEISKKFQQSLSNK